MEHTLERTAFLHQLIETLGQSLSDLRTACPAEYDPDGHEIDVCGIVTLKGHVKTTIQSAMAVRDHLSTADDARPA